MANSKKRCRYCKEYFDAESMVKVPLGFFCTYAHATEHGQKKAANKVHKEKRKAHKQAKESIMTASDWIKKAQSSVNAYVRIRDKERPCISCGNYITNKIGGNIDAGHYRSRGAAGHLRFNLFNIHAQCVKCNRYDSGNVVDYRIRLIDKIGVFRVERLENDNKPKKLTIDYLKRLHYIFLKRARHIKKIRGYD
jgi:hypothetical protein